MNIYIYAYINVGKNQQKYDFKSKSNYVRHNDLKSESNNFNKD